MHRIPALLAAALSLESPSTLVVETTRAAVPGGASSSTTRTTYRKRPPPNIVLIFPDNIGVGEVGVYGGNRGVPTPDPYTPLR